MSASQKTVADMTDDEVLTAAGPFGPGIIGKELFDRAESIRKNNPTGALGPAITGNWPKGQEPEGEPVKKSHKKKAE